MLKITIPKPCHEDWAAMQPNEQGRHCNSCAKTVIDFTGMSDDEVKHFLINKANKRVCGRFTSTQLQRVRITIPEKIFQIPMPLWKRFLAASLLAFGATLFSCDANIEKTPANNRVEAYWGAKIMSEAEQSNKRGIYLGMPRACIKPPIQSQPSIPVTQFSPPYQNYITGDLAVMPALPDTSYPVITQPEITTGEIAPVQVKIDSANCNVKKYY